MARHVSYPSSALQAQGPGPTTDASIHTGRSSDNSSTMIVAGIRPSTQMAPISGLEDLTFNSSQRNSVMSHTAGLTMRPGHPPVLHRDALFWPQPANTEKRPFQASCLMGARPTLFRLRMGQCGQHCFKGSLYLIPPSGIRAHRSHFTAALGKG